MDRWPKCVPRSSTLRVTAIPAPEAETLLATTWCILVENALASPEIEVRLSETSIDMHLRFSSAEDCALVEKRIYELLASGA
jgi:hypothetical protein